MQKKVKKTFSAFNLLQQEIGLFSGSSLVESDKNRHAPLCFPTGVWYTGKQQACRPLKHRKRALGGLP